MPVLQKIAYFRGIRNEVPNQELARELFENRDTDGVAEIVANLNHPQPNVQSGCLKVLYELGYLDAEMIVPYTEHFIELLKSRNNRMVWGAMIALSVVAHLVPDQLFKQVELIKRTVDRGSVITRDGGLAALGKVAAAKTKYHAALFDYLLTYVKECRPKDIARYAEDLEPAALNDRGEELAEVLKSRIGELTPSMQKRIEKILSRLSA